MLIFDLDGTLIDSNGVWVDVDKTFLGRRGVAYSKEYHDGVAHTILQNAALFTKDYLNLKESCEEIIAEWLELAKDAYSHVPLKPHAREFLEKCKAEGQQMIIFTASVPSHCRTALANLEIGDYFYKIIFAKKMGVNKNTPEIFYRVADMFHVDPKDCVLFDDSLAACKAAKTAGMKVVGVQDDHAKDDWEDMRKLCDRFVTDFGELL